MTEVDPRYPQVCFDERPVQLLSDVRAPLPARPGTPPREDYEYERRGTANLFLWYEPLRSHRHVVVTEHRRRDDWAHCIKDLVDVHYPDAEKIILVMDNLNIHSPASLYVAFEPKEAKRLADKLEIHYTPKHGSWLNMAEIELAVLSGQCLDRRIPDTELLTSEVAAWEDTRNETVTSVNWRFTTADARIKLKHLYQQYFGNVQSHHVPAAFPELTDLECEILTLIAQRQSTAEIAGRLVLSPKTIRNHVSNTLSKLQVADRVEAMLAARAAGLGGDSIFLYKPR